MSPFTVFALLFLVMDPFGNSPVFLSILKGFDSSQRRKIIVRESLIALAVLVFFMLAGRHILSVLDISSEALRISGGIILLLISIRMIFSVEVFPRGNEPAEPLIVPLAVPSIAGPAAMTMVMLLTASEPTRWPVWLAALVGASFCNTVVLLLVERLSRLFGSRGLAAMEKLMGMVLTTIAIEMLISGIKDIINTYTNVAA